MYDRTNLYAAQSFHRFASGDHTRAIADAVDVIGRLASMKMSAYWNFHALEAALDTLFTAAKNPNRDLGREIARGCAEGRRMARFCVFARPSALLWDGRRLALSGKVLRARALWGKAEALAREKDVTWVAETARRLLQE